MVAFKSVRPQPRQVRVEEVDARPALEGKPLHPISSYSSSAGVAMETWTSVSGTSRSEKKDPTVAGTFTMVVKRHPNGDTGAIKHSVCGTQSQEFSILSSTQEKIR